MKNIITTIILLLGLAGQLAAEWRTIAHKKDVMSKTRAYSAQSLKFVRDNFPASFGKAAVYLRFQCSTDGLNGVYFHHSRLNLTGARYSGRGRAKYRVVVKVDDGPAISYDVGSSAGSDTVYFLSRPGATKKGLINKIESGRVAHVRWPQYRGDLTETFSLEGSAEAIAWARRLCARQD